VLVVENSQSVAQMVAVHVSERLGREAQVVRTLEQARAALRSRSRGGWLAAVVNLELPDAADEEIVTLTLSHGVPTVVLTGTVNEAKRQRILQHDILDYCLKGKTGIEAMVRVLARLERNPSLQVMVVDDVASSRAQQLGLLASQRFDVLQAQSPQQALALYTEHPEIVLILVNLSSHDQTLELVGALRERAGQDDLAIVAMSAIRTPHAPAEHLKAGSSDFLAKPFEKEEYFCRVYACIDRVENMRRIKQLAFTDGLTKLANRLAFFSRAPELLGAALQDGAKPVVALVSVDGLNEINDTHGYAAGDQALAEVAQSVMNSLGPDALCARFTGQQFCVAIRNASETAAVKLFERLRANVERTSFMCEKTRLDVSVSCGVVLCKPDDEDNIDGWLNRAADALEEAAEAGGNTVVIRA
jgi:diguanylate cyclase (GGDEF)-like protein